MMGRRLERHLDLDLIARLASGNKHQPKPVKSVKPPRHASTYRGARRNALRPPKDYPTSFVEVEA